jgi:hypothetical protein
VDAAAFVALLSARSGHSLVWKAVRQSLTHFPKSL